MKTNTKAKLLTLGLKEGKLVSINDSENGKDCNCFCPCCHNSLVAKNNGKVKIAHFAHLAAKDCPGAIESAIHLLCKEILLDKKKIFVPSYVHFYSKFQCQQVLIKYDALLHFDKIEVEKRIDIGKDFIIADAVGYVGDRMLIIEFANTHFVDELKKEKLKKLGIPCLEYSISKGSQNIEELTTQLFYSDFEPKWIVNKKGKDLIPVVGRELSLKQAEIDLESRIAQDKKRKEQAEVYRRYEANEQSLKKKRNDTLGIAKSKGELRLTCPIQKKLRILYDVWLSNLHPIVMDLKNASHLSNIYDRLPYYIDVFIDKKREFLIPENFEKLPSQEQILWEQKLQAAKSYLQAKENTHLNFCGICKFYEGVSYEYIICKYSLGSDLANIFNSKDLYKMNNDSS